MVKQLATHANCELATAVEAFCANGRNPERALRAIIEAGSKELACAPSSRRPHKAFPPPPPQRGTALGKRKAPPGGTGGRGRHPRLETDVDYAEERELRRLEGRK